MLLSGKPLYTFPGSTLAGVIFFICAATAVTAAGSLPPFVSLVADAVEVRAEPGADKPVALVFRRAGLPVTVLDERAGWVRIEDNSGTIGWVSAALLSRRRTAIVLAPSAGAPETTRALRASARSTSDVLAYLEPGVIVGVVACDGRTCRITTTGVRGFVDQDHLWGVAVGEIVK